MEYIDHKITLDIRDTVSHVSLSVKQGETWRRLRIHLSDNGYPYHIGDDCYAVFTAKKPDGTSIFSRCTIDDCVIIYDFTVQTTAAIGLVECEIRLYGKEDKMLISASFLLEVHDTAWHEGDIESKDELDALHALIAKGVTEYLKKNPISGTLSAMIGEVELKAAKWAGSGNLYSQVVSVNGLPEVCDIANCQVDLTPSVDQLLVFYEKDLTFSTVNDDGILTVYAIGQKPTNDYVIQVTVTEVIA